MKTRNKIQKLALVALTMIGTLTQIGCGGIGLEGCPGSPQSGTFKGTFDHPNFSGEVEVVGKLTQWCSDSSYVKNLELSVTNSNNLTLVWDSHFGGGPSSSSVQAFSETLNSFNSEIQYSINAFCEHVETDRDGSIPSTSEDLNCEFKLTSSDNSENININFSIELEE